MTNVADVTLAVLAGGRGVRMGMAKAWLRVGGKPILEHLWERLGWEGPTMVVCAPGVEGPPGVELWGREVVDRVAGQGPLRGILTALEQATTPIVVITTVDMVAVTHEMLVKLLDELRGDAKAAGAMYGRNGRAEPFPCALRREMTDVVARRIERGELSVQGLAREAVKITMALPRSEWGDGVWRNLNTPEDLQAFETEQG